MFALLPVALVIGAYFYVTGGAVMSTDNAYVQADVVGVSNDISGIVSQVMVRDNQTVAKGDVLFKLDDQQFKLALDRANAQLGMTKNQLLALRTSYKDMQAQIEQAKADIALDQLNFDRQQKLVVNNYTAQATLDATRNTLQAAQQKFASLKEQLAGIAARISMATPTRRSRIILVTRMRWRHATKRRSPAVSSSGSASRARSRSNPRSC